MQIQRLSFNDQLGYFQKTIAEINNLIGGPRATKLLNEALYVVVFGSNDYINNYLLKNSATSRQYTPLQYQNLLVATFRKQLAVSSSNMTGFYQNLTPTLVSSL